MLSVNPVEDFRERLIYLTLIINNMKYITVKEKMTLKTDNQFVDYPNLYLCKIRLFDKKYVKFNVLSILPILN